MTFFNKRVVPGLILLGVGGFVAGVLAASRRSDGPPWFIALIPAGMFVFVFFMFRKMIFDLADEVYDCGDHLLVKRSGQEVQIFLRDIKNISASMFINPPRVTLSLRVPCPFGSEVSFTPVRPPFANPFRPHPSVTDLIDRVDLARR